MLHKLIDTTSNKEIISDDKHLEVYKSRAEVKYIGEIDAVPTETEEGSENPSPKSKKNK